MLRDDGAGAVRVYQVEIKSEYLKDLFQFDAGSVEQEVFARADDGVICVVTDRPQTIFTRLGEAVKSVTYLGPLVELPPKDAVFHVRQAQQNPRPVWRETPTMVISDPSPGPNSARDFADAL